MINYDLHIHTEYCGHAPQMQVKKIIKRANELDLETIAIAAHIYSPKELPLLTRIRNDVAAVEGRCKIIVGAEVDVDGRYCDGRLVTDELKGIDYLVAGFHYVPGVGNYPHSPADCSLPAQEMFNRWESSLLGVVADSRLHVLAHPSRLIGVSVNLDLFFNKALDVFEQAAKLSVKNEIAWEINELSGLKIPQDYKHRWHEIFQIAFDTGVKLLYGSDAHEPESIGVTDFTQNILQKLPRNCLSNPQSLGIF